MLYHVISQLGIALDTLAFWAVHSKHSKQPMQSQEHDPVISDTNSKHVHVICPTVAIEM